MDRCKDCDSVMILAKGYCGKCYQRYRDNRQRKGKRDSCSINGCTGTSHARSLCRKHYGDWYRKTYDERIRSGESSATVPSSSADMCRRELERAQKCYDQSRSPAARKRWFGEIRRLEEQLTDLEKKKT